MGVLQYAATMSLDGYVADAAGDFQWVTPNDSVFELHLERIAEVSTEVLGRKTYALMEYWETFRDHPDRSASERAFARRWQAIDKVVVSSTMHRGQLASNRSRLIRELPLSELQQIVADAEGSVEIFGPTTAAQAIRAGMVDRFECFIVPKMVGGGLRALPTDVHLGLRLIRHRVFDNGIVYGRYVPR